MYNIEIFLSPVYKGLIRVLLFMHVSIIKQSLLVVLMFMLILFRSDLT